MATPPHPTSTSVVAKTGSPAESKTVFDLRQQMAATPVQHRRSPAPRTGQQACRWQSRQNLPPTRRVGIAGARQFSQRGAVGAEAHRGDRLRLNEDARIRRAYCATTKHRRISAAVAARRYTARSSQPASGTTASTSGSMAEAAAAGGARRYSQAVRADPAATRVRSATPARGVPA